MTTVAYKDGILAYDSRMTKGDTIISDKCNKKHERDGVIFIIYGQMSAIDRIIDAYFDKEICLPINAGGIVIDTNKNRMFNIGYDDEDETPHLWKSPMTKDIPQAWGSGQDFANMAMYLGLNAKTAIEQTKKFDTGTGGRIHTIELKTLLKREGELCW